MTLREYYAYIKRARRALWPALLELSDNEASAPIPGDVWSCLKHLAFHAASAEDAWMHEDVQRVEPLLLRNEALQGADAASLCSVLMADIVAYWQEVEAATDAYLERVQDDEFERVMTPWDDPSWKLRVGDVIWHVMTHEVRHTAQIVAQLRAVGRTPPSLDLLFHLPERDLLR